MGLQMQTQLILITASEVGVIIPILQTNTLRYTATK